MRSRSRSRPESWQRAMSRNRSRSRSGARSGSRSWSRNGITTTPKLWQGYGVGVGVTRSHGNEPGFGVRIGQEPWSESESAWGPPRLRNPVTLLVEMKTFPKSHYRHHTGTSEVGINTGILPACHMLYYCVDLINTGNLPAACRYYQHAGNVVMKFRISTC